MRTDRKRQKRHLLPGLWLAAMLLMLSLTAGCGKSGKNAQSEPAAPAKTEFELAEPEKDRAQELLEAAGQHPEELQGIAEAVLQAAGENPEAAQDIAEAVLQVAEENPETAQSIAEAVLDAAEETPETAQGIAEAVLQAAEEKPEDVQNIAEAVLEAAGADPEQVKDAAGKAQEAISSSSKQESKPAIDEDGWYDSKDEVALYIHTYGHLPDNYITKKEAQKLGWPGGSLEPYAPGKSIGGDHFGNYEGLLPKVKGSSYRECDIGTAGRKSRGAKRIIFSDDGRIYYTDDHYESFTQLY